MAKGNSSHNSLKALAYPLQQFIRGWSTREKPNSPKPSANRQAALPAPYELAAVKGEAILRQRFFGALMDKIPATLDASQQLATWHQLVEDGGHITAWVERLGIAKALRREAVMPLLDTKHASQEHRKLYTLLLDALHNQAPELLPKAVEGYFWHCWRQQFPSTAVVQDKNITQTEVLRTRLMRHLRKLHGNGVEIKESFVQSSGAVDFSILWRKAANDPWQTLHQNNRPRLKPARLAAYLSADLAADSDVMREGELPPI